MSDARIITPAKAARGLGATRTGTSHHIRQRVAALALIVLVPWFLYAMVSAGALNYEDARAYFARPHNMLLLTLISFAAIYHMRLGLQVVIEDYIGKSGSRSALLILNTFACITLFIVLAGSIFRIWTGASV
jgi:succinate dehydrogenase / fumarate reductase membrane anchor subunit